MLVKLKIWRQTPKVIGNLHFSHRIAFAPDGTIFLSSGDRQKLTPAQDRNSDLGKIIHMTDEGQRIGGNFATMGHRNVLGLAFASDGRLWATEMGPQGGDELNLIVAGRNYGWPHVSYGSHYGGGPIPDGHKGRGFEEPKRWWTPSISPAGLMIYSGERFPQWRGDALFGALSDRIGRRTMMLIFGLLTTVATVPLLTAIGQAQSPVQAFALVLAALVCVSFYTSISGIVKAEMFPPEVRALAVGLSYAIGNAAFGGTAEYVALLFKSQGHESAFFWYVAIICAIALAASWIMPDSRKHGYLKA